MDKRSKAMLMLGLLNDAYGDVKNLLYYLHDFVISHPEMSDEIEKFGVREVMDKAKELEKSIIEAMDRLKVVVYG